MTRTAVFVSYSHQDEAEKNELLIQLGVLQRAGLLEVWSDDQIRGGEDWQQKIQEAMARARVAILLISAHFLNSDFILTHEVPALLRRRREEGLIILPLIAKACPWRSVPWLAEINVRPRDGRPIWRDRGSHAEEALAQIAEEVQTLIDAANAPPLANHQPDPQRKKSESKECQQGSGVFISGIQGDFSGNIVAGNDVIIHPSAGQKRKSGPESRKEDS